MQMKNEFRFLNTDFFFLNTGYFLQLLNSTMFEKRQLI